MERKTFNRIITNAMKGSQEYEDLKADACEALGNGEGMTADEWNELVDAYARVWRDNRGLLMEDTHDLAQSLANTYGENLGEAYDAVAALQTL